MPRRPGLPAAPIDPQRLREASRRLFDRATRVVGWGTGSVFEYFHDLHPVRLDCLVDNDATRWGQSRHGLEIRPPAALAAEDPERTFVVIYSGFWPDIQASLAAAAPGLESLPASAVFADTTVRARLTRAEALATHVPAPRGRPAGDDAIVVQGPVLPGVTARVLRAMAALHSDAAIVLSTWRDTAPEAIDALRPFVDDVVQSDVPDPAGIQNRNCQIVSTRAGVERAFDLGARWILKTRTDLAVLDPDVFARGRWWLDRAGSGAARAAGLADRLIVPSSFTRKYFLYHPSDLVMLGAAPDLLTFWSAPLDPRTGTLLQAPWIDRPIAEVNLDGNPTESYLGLALCRALERPVTGTLEDSWAFYRDLFAVVDNDWFELLWYKNLAIPDAAVRHGVRQTVSQAFWEHLQSDVRPEACRRRDADVDPTAVALGALVGARAS